MSEHYVSELPDVPDAECSSALHPGAGGNAPRTSACNPSLDQLDDLQTVLSSRPGLPFGCSADPVDPGRADFFTPLVECV